MIVSCMLQPAIIAGFVAAVLTVFDTAVYGNCEFNRIDYSFEDYNFSTFQLVLPSAEIEKCQESPGYKMLGYASGLDWEEKRFMLFKIPVINDTQNMIKSMTYLMLYMALFYYLIKSANSMASKVTGGPDLSAVTVSPNLVVDKVINLAKATAMLAVAAVKLGMADIGGAIGDTIGAARKGLTDTSASKKKEDDDPEDKIAGSGGGNESDNTNAAADGELTKKGVGGMLDEDKK